MSLSAVRDADGYVTHYVCMFTDISEEKSSSSGWNFGPLRPLDRFANRRSLANSWHWRCAKRQSMAR